MPTIDKRMFLQVLIFITRVEFSVSKQSSEPKRKRANNQDQ